MKHEDVFSLKKFIHERRKKQKQDQAANALERIGSFVDSVNIHNPAPTIPTKVNSRKTIALSPTKERVGECGGCTTDKKDILTNNEGFKQKATTVKASGSVPIKTKNPVISNSK